MKNVKLEQLLGYLSKQASGVFANQIEADIGFNERLVRAIAAQSGGRIVSGNSGYKLTVNASLDEKVECIGRLRSQALQMNTRASAVDAVWHEHNANRNQPPLPMEGNPLIRGPVLVTETSATPHTEPSTSATPAQVLEVLPAAL